MAPPMADSPAPGSAADEVLKTAEVGLPPRLRPVEEVQVTAIAEAVQDEPRRRRKAKRRPAASPSEPEASLGRPPP